MVFYGKRTAEEISESRIAGTIGLLKSYKKLLKITPCTKLEKARDTLDELLGTIPFEDAEYSLIIGKQCPYSKFLLEMTDRNLGIIDSKLAQLAEGGFHDI